MSTNDIGWWVGGVGVFILLWKRGGLLLKFLLALVLVGAFLQVAPNAFAAEAPHIRCGDKVTWTVWRSGGTPEAAEAAIAAAYTEINAAGANLTIRVAADPLDGTATSVSTWDDPGAGIVHAEGDAEDVNAGTGVTALVHHHSATGPSAGPALKALAVLDVGREFGLTWQATGGHLTKADRAALKAACSTSATQASSTPAPAAGPNVTAAPDGAATVDVARTATTPAPRPASHTVSDSDKTLSNIMLAGSAGGFVLVLFGGRLRKLLSKRGIKGPSLAGVKGWFGRLRSRRAGFRRPFARNNTK